MKTRAQIAQKLDEFYYEQDPYGYFDDVDSRPQGLLRVFTLISTIEGTRQAQYEVAAVVAEDPCNQTHADLLSDLIALAEVQEKIPRPTTELIKVVIVKVNEPPCIMEKENNLKSSNEIVGGYIEAIQIADNMIIICNEEGKLKNLPGNRRVGCDIIAGDFFVTASNYEGELISLTAEQQVKALTMFAKTENYTGLDMADEIFLTFKLL